MTEVLIQIGFWHWVTLTTILIVFEFLRPGRIFLWLAIASGCVSVVSFVNPSMAWTTQLLVFAIFAFASVVSWQLSTRMFPTSYSRERDDKGDILVGRSFELHEAIIHGKGKIKAGGSTWRVLGPDNPAGTMVKVVGAKGSSLFVEPYE